jgi:hypothetical protein
MVRFGEQCLTRLLRKVLVHSGYRWQYARVPRFRPTPAATGWPNFGYTIAQEDTGN